MIISYLRIRANDYYSCDLTSQFPVRVMIRAINGDVGLGLVTADDETDIVNYVKGLQSSQSIEYVAITHKSSMTYWTEVKQISKKPGIYSTVLENGSMSQLPIIIEDGWQYHQVLSPNAESLRQVISALKENFAEVKLLRSSNTPQFKSGILTSKQQEMITVAYNMGYYDLPRRATITELGEILGISRSASQERLHRAERSIISYFLDDYRYRG